MVGQSPSNYTVKNNLEGDPAISGAHRYFRSYLDSNPLESHPALSKMISIVWKYIQIWTGLLSSEMEMNPMYIRSKSG